MADHCPDTEGGGIRLRPEVVVPESPARRPQILVALSVVLVLLAGAVDALLWKQARERAADRPPVRVRVVMPDHAASGSLPDTAAPGRELGRLDLEVAQTQREIDRLLEAVPRRVDHSCLRAAPPTHPSEILGSPPF